MFHRPTKSACRGFYDSGVVVCVVVFVVFVLLLLLLSVYEKFPGTGFNLQLVARESFELAYSMSGLGPVEGPCLSEGSELSDLP